MNGTVFGNIFSVVYFLFFIAGGFLIADRFLRKERLVTRIWIGGSAGILLLQWLPVPFSFLFGFNRISHLCAALLLAVIVGACFYFTRHRKDTPSYRLSNRDIMILGLCACFTALATVLLSTHTIPIENGAMMTGQSTYGDMNLHLSIVTSMAEQGAFPPHYSTYPVAQMAYPFLSDSVSASLYLWDSSLRLAYILPAVFAFFNVFLGLCTLVDTWRKRHVMVVVFAFLLFFVNGGFGLIYFLDNWGNDFTNFTRIFTEFYQTPTNYVDQGNIMWVNNIADMLLPQRATLFGWNALFPALFFLIKGQFHEERKYFVGAALFAGALPMIHTHSFLSVFFISVAWFLFGFIGAKNKKRHFCSWATFGVLVAVLAAWQLFVWTFKQSGNTGFMQLSPGWDNGTRSQLNDIIPLPFIDDLTGEGAKSFWQGVNQLIAPWFWIKNVGIVLLMLIPTLFAMKKKDWLFHAGALMIFLPAVIIQFQPNPYDNNKLLLVWYLLSLISVVNYCADLYVKVRHIGGVKVIAAMVLITGTLAGGLTIGREAVSKYTLYSAPQVAAAEYIKENTPADSVFLTADNHNNVVSSIAGRNLVVGGSEYILYSHGLEVSEVYENVRYMYASPEAFEAFRHIYNVDYIFIGEHETYGYISPSMEQHLKRHYPLVYNQQGVRIYQITK